MSVYKRIGDRVYYFKSAAAMAAFLNSEAEKTAKAEKKNNKKNKKV